MSSYPGIISLRWEVLLLKTFGKGTRAIDATTAKTWKKALRLIEEKTEFLAQLKVDLLRR